MRTLMSFLTVLLLIPFASAATQYKFAPEMGKVGFKTKGWPNLVTIKGEGKGVTGALQETEGKVSGELVFNLDSLKTGIELRDSHMKDNYLETKKHPTAKLVLTNVEFPKDLDGDMKFKGMMTLHGVEKEVEGKAELDNDGGQIKMTAEIPVKLSDFKIAIPAYKGITVAEKVKINFETKVTKQ